MKPTNAQIADAIRELGHIVWDEVFRHPGADWDEHDREAWRTVCRRLVDAYKRNPDMFCRWSQTGHAWAAPAWALRFALRNAKFRPTWEEVGNLFTVHLGAAKVEVVSGADAAARTIYTAPPMSPVAALPAGATNGRYAPPWLEEFRRTVSRDNGGPADRVMVSPLMHLPDDAALVAVRAMARGKREYLADREESAAKAAENRAARERRQSGGDALGAVCRELRGMAE